MMNLRHECTIPPRLAVDSEQIIKITKIYWFKVFNFSNNHSNVKLKFKLYLKKKNFFFENSIILKKHLLLK
jgi:hypothetical protein